MKYLIRALVCICLGAISYYSFSQGALIYGVASGVGAIGALVAMFHDASKE